MVYKTDLLKLNARLYALPLVTWVGIIPGLASFHYCHQAISSRLLGKHSPFRRNQIKYTQRW